MEIEHTRIDSSNVDVKAGSLVNEHGMADWQAVSEEISQSSTAEIDPRTRDSRSGGVELAAFHDQSYEAATTPDPSQHLEQTTDRDSSSGLALQSLAPDVSLDIEDEATELDYVVNARAIAEISGYGTPKKGPIGALLYWYTVHQRKKVLAEEHAQAESRLSEADQKKRESLAALGRKAAELKIQDSSLKALIGKASLAQGELRGKERQKTHLSQEHRASLKPLEAKLKILDQDAEPLRVEEAKIKGEHGALMAQCRHIETKKKRFQIDLRNMDDLIGKRQEALLSPETPEEEKDKLFKEVGQFEGRRPGLIEEVEACDKALAKLAVPVSGLEAQLSDIQTKLAAKISVIQGVADEIKSISENFAKVEGAVAQAVQAESEKVENAWADVGQQIIHGKEVPQELAVLKKQAIASITNGKEARKKLALVARARDSYDRNTISAAKKVAIATLVVIAVLIALAIVFN